MTSPLFQTILITLACSALVVFFLKKLRMPSILGFLITGILIGPYGLGFIQAAHEIELISEIGVILLLFVIGMELSLKQLASIKKTIFIGGFAQVGGSIIIAAVLSNLLGFSWKESVFFGFLFSLSSTAIVLKILQDRNEISAPHGRNALGILIFQDIIVIPMMLVTPLLAGDSANVIVAVGELLLKSAVVIALTFLGARYIVPHLMHLIAKTKSKELFLIATLAICFAVAFLTSEAGFSLALGAFLAGIIISESEYSHQATSIILPFKELFSSFFFISIGMLLNLHFFTENAITIFIIVLVVFILKTSIAALSTALLKYPPRVVLLTGLSLFQIGEFSFILSKVGIEYGFISTEINQYFLSVSIITMFLTPFIIMFSENLAYSTIPSFLQRKLSSSGYLNNNKDKQEDDQELENHLLIIGYGINGRNVAKAAKHVNIPYLIIELNADTVLKEKDKGERIIFGDASHTHILNLTNINKARAVVVAISDPTATRYIVSNIRQVSKAAYIIVRTRYVNEIDDLFSLGANEVIPEEFETSVAIFFRVLQNFLVPIDEIENLVKTIRADHYKIFHSESKIPRTITPTKIPNFHVTCLRVEADSGELIGKSIGEAHIRKRFGINIIAIARKNKMLYPINPELKICQNDLIYVSGNSEQINNFYKAVK